MKQILLFTCIIFGLNSFAATYYSDPVAGNMANPGTAASPWSNLEAVMNSSFVFASGDVIICRNGNHGFPKINGVNSSYVTIQAQSGHTPTCTRIYFGSTSSASYWKFSGITFELENTASSPLRLVDIFANCDHITLENCNLRSSTNVASWTRTDWRTKACTGVWVRGGTGHIIQNCSIMNVAIGIINDATFTLVNNNTVENFTIDGIRGNGSDSQYNENLIQNNIIVYTYAENHYDGFQAFTSDTIKNVLFRKNTIICTTDTTRAYRGSMQGMGCFDGFYQNWTIENNLIITDHWHGITLLGALNCRIVNNTVIDNYLVTPVDPLDSQSQSAYGPAWIKIAAHKNGQSSTGNYIGNNICNTMQNDIGIGTVTNNVLVPMSDYANHFVNAPANQFQLIATSTAIDAGTTAFTPSTDISGAARPQGVTFDAGAYEYGCSATLSLSATNLTVCAGDSTSVSASGSFTSMSWNNSVSDGVSFYPASSGYYAAIATNGSCSVEDSIYITVNSLPVVSFQLNSPTLCMGDSVNLNTGSAFSPAGGIFSGTNVSNDYLYASSIGATEIATYMYQDGNGCVATASDNLTVTNCCTTTLSLSASNSSVCSGESTTVTASGNFTTVNWDNSVSNGVSFVPSASGYYTATASDGSCAIMDSIFITVNSLPVVSFQMNNPTLCAGDSMNLNTGSTYSPNGGTFSGSNVLNDYLYASSVGATETATYIYQDGNGCIASATDNLSVISCCSLNMTLSASNASICIGDSTSVSASGNFNSVIWDNSISDGVSFYPVASGFYTATGADAFCNVSDSIFITVNNLPVVSLQFNDSTICDGDSLDLTSESYFNPIGGVFSGANVSNDYLYSLGIGSSQIVIYTYQDGNGCESFAYDSILVIDCSVGINVIEKEFVVRYESSRLVIELDELPTEVYLYDLSGKLVFNDKSPSNMVSFDFSDYETGVYLAGIVIGNQLITVKVKL